MDLALVDEKVLNDFVAKEADRRATEAAATAKRKAKEEQERKALEEKGQYETLRTQLEARATQAEQTLQVREAFYALKVAALTAGAQNAEDVQLLADADVAACLKDGQVVPEAVTKAIESLKAARPYLFKASTGAHPAFAGAPSPGSAAPALPQAGEVTPESVMRARQDRQARTKNLQQPSAADALLALLNRGGK